MKSTELFNNDSYSESDDFKIVHVKPLNIAPSHIRDADVKKPPGKELSLTQLICEVIHSKKKEKEEKKVKIETEIKKTSREK